MRTIVVAMILSCAVIARAESTFELPPGYKEHPAGVEAQIATLRAQPDTIAVDAMAHIAPDGRVHLLRVSGLFRTGGRAPRDALEEADRGFMSGMSAGEPRGVKHISSTRRFEDGQLVSEAVDELMGKRGIMRRISAVDADGVLHMMFIICSGPKDELGYCQRSQQTMKVTLPQRPAAGTLPSASRSPPVMPSPPHDGSAPTPGGARPDQTSRDDTTSAGSIVGGAALIALAVGLAAWIIHSARRGPRRRRRR